MTEAELAVALRGRGWPFVLILDGPAWRRLGHHAPSDPKLRYVYVCREGIYVWITTTAATITDQPRFDSAVHQQLSLMWGELRGGARPGWIERR